MALSITIIIIIVTCIVSFTAFGNEKIIDDLIFYPPAVTHRKQWYRFFSCGLIHADIMHLLFNMYALYIFGRPVENAFIGIFGNPGKIIYLAMYISALLVCLLPTFAKHKDDYHYRSLGASGAVSAVVFAYILLYPTQELGLVFLPGVGIPGFLFGTIYLVISSFLGRKGMGNINHSAHIWGGIYGFAFLIVTAQIFSNYPVLGSFVEQVKSYLGGI